jgi:uncharacterized protein
LNPTADLPHPNTAMPPNATPRRQLSISTGLGLFIALFAIIIARKLVDPFSPTLTFTTALWKESLIWLSAVALLIVICRGERLPLSSVGLGTRTWWKSILWGVLLSLPCFLVALLLVALTGYGHGPGAAAFEKLPLWLITLIVLRAGVVEELFYRGYTIERLEGLGMGRRWAVAIPLVIFSIGHLSGGWANVLIALALGAILSAFYLWRRDLVANMIGHGLVDFLANVLPRLFSWETVEKL